MWRPINGHQLVSYNISERGALNGNEDSRGNLARTTDSLVPPIRHKSRIHQVVQRANRPLGGDEVQGCPPVVVGEIEIHLPILQLLATWRSMHNIAFETDTSERTQGVLEPVFCQAPMKVSRDGRLWFPTRERMIQREHARPCIRVLCVALAPICGLSSMRPAFTHQHTSGQSDTLGNHFPEGGGRRKPMCGSEAKWRHAVPFAFTRSSSYFDEVWWNCTPANSFACTLIHEIRHAERCPRAGEM